MVERRERERESEKERERKPMVTRGVSHAHQPHPPRRRPLSSSRRREEAKSAKSYSKIKVSFLHPPSLILVSNTIELVP